MVFGTFYFGSVMFVFVISGLRFAWLRLLLL